MSPEVAKVLILHVRKSRTRGSCWCTNQVLGVLLSTWPTLQRPHGGLRSQKLKQLKLVTTSRRENRYPFFSSVETVVVVDVVCSTLDERSGAFCAMLLLLLLVADLFLRL